MQQQGLNRSLSPHTGMQMKHMVASHLGPTSHGSSSYEQPSTLSPAESDRNYKITARLNAKNFMGNVFTRFVLPHDPEHAHEARAAEYFRQSAMPWGSVYMHTPTDPNRLNNPAQSSFVKQRQLNVGSTYGQFYAFMHALSAAFGNLSTGNQ
jgi:hypothetical protein